MKKLLEVKKKIGVLSKNSKNPFFKSQYLDLNDLLNEVEPLLWEQGLILTQPIRDGFVYSLITDTEDNTLIGESYLALPPITDPQKLGSCITYFRRYTLKSLLSISEQDDDGNLASKKTVKKDKLSPTVEQKALARIEKGELELIQKLKDKFDLTVEQVTKLDSYVNT